MGLVMDSAELSRQLALRALSKRELADVAGLSPASISHALSGRPVSPSTFRRICEALAARRPLDGAADLLGR